jgi:hypothetical protein
MSMNSSITSLAPVKYNAQRDVRERRHRVKRRKGNSSSVEIYPQSTANDDVFSILPREVCLRRAPNASNSHKRLYTDTDLDVFSSLNKAAVASTEDVSPENARIRLRKEFDFGGVAVTRAWCDSSSSTNSNNEMVVLFGGTFTIRNTGVETIFSGQWVMWDLPFVSEQKRGNKHTWRSDQVPSDKLLVETRPFTPANMFPTREELVGQEPDIEDIASEFSKTLGDDDTGFSTAFKKMEAVFHGPRRRVFARALSTGEAGKEFDVVLGRYMA